MGPCFGERRSACQRRRATHGGHGGSGECLWLWRWQSHWRQWRRSYRPIWSSSSWRWRDPLGIARRIAAPRRWLGLVTAGRLQRALSRDLRRLDRWPWWKDWDLGFGYCSSLVCWAWRSGVLALVEHLVIPSWPSDTCAWLAVQNQMIPIYLFLKKRNNFRKFPYPFKFLGELSFEVRWTPKLTKSPYNSSNWVEGYEIITDKYTL